MMAVPKQKIDWRKSLTKAGSNNINTYQSNLSNPTAFNAF